jgi:hypothetical protein
MESKHIRSLLNQTVSLGTMIEEMLGYVDNRRLDDPDLCILLESIKSEANYVLIHLALRVKESKN